MAERKSLKAMFFDGDWAKLRAWEFGPFVLYYVVYFAVRALARNRGTVLTASLAFATALSVVPLLSVALSVLLTFGNLDDGASLEPYIQQLFPAAASGIVTYLNVFAKTSASEVAGVGALAFFAVAFFLFVSIERAFNIIWASHRKRGLAQQVGSFLLIMTFGPILLSFSFGLTTYAAIRFEQFHIDAGVLLVLLPFVLAFIVFTAMNHFLPTTRVNAWASVLAGAFTAAAFELGKYGFNLYVTELILVPYNQVYGALGLFPLFLIWLYVIWIIVLFGASLAYTAQNLRTIVRVESAVRRGTAGEHVFVPTIGLELYAPIARAFKTGEGRLADRDLVAATGYSEVVVRAVVDELAEIGALEIVEEEEGERRLLPAKQLEDIELWPMLEAFFDFDRPTEALPVQDLLRRYKTVSLDVLSGQSALAFVPASANAGRVDSRPRRVPTPQPMPAPVSRPETPVPAPSAPEPLVDADLFESPPRLAGAFEGATLDAKPAPSARAIVQRAQHLGGAPADGERREATTASPRPMPAIDRTVDEPTAVEASDDGIRIHTQDILVEDVEPDDDEPAPKPAGTAHLLKQALKSRAVGKKKKKEPSIEIDIAGMWDDFEVDNYEEALSQASEDLRRTDQLDVDELGDERSFPPRGPGDKK